MEIKIVRDEIPIETVYAEMLDDKLRILIFQAFRQIRMMSY